MFRALTQCVRVLFRELMWPPEVVLALAQVFAWFCCLVSISRERLGVPGLMQSFLPWSTQPGWWNFPSLRDSGGQRRQNP